MAHAFPWLLTAGALAGLAWLAWERPSDLRSVSPEADGRVRFDAGLAALGGGLVLGRAGYAALHPGAFAGRWEELLWFWAGGLSAPAGIAGGVLGLFLFAGLSSRPFWPLADELAAPALVLAASLWAGCALDGCAYGAKADLGWLTPPLPDAFGGVARRLPVQPAGVLLSLAPLVPLSTRRAARLPAGVRAALALGGVTATLVVLSGWRADPAVLVVGVRAEALASAVVLLLAAAAAIWCRKRGATGT